MEKQYIENNEKNRKKINKKKKKKKKKMKELPFYNLIHQTSKKQTLYQPNIQEKKIS